MRGAWFGRGWFVSAVKFALGVPASVFLGIATALSLGMTVGRLLPEWTMTVIWLLGFALAAVLVWLLVRHRVRSEGWRRLALGLAGAAAIAAGSYTLGELTQAYAPGENGMAGLAWIVFGYISGVAVVLAAAMGLVAARIDLTRRAREMPGQVEPALPADSGSR